MPLLFKGHIYLVGFHLSMQLMKTDHTKLTCTLLFKDTYILSLYSAGPLHFSGSHCAHIRTEKDGVEECGAVASVVFLERGSLCFQLGNVQAKLKLGEWSPSQRLHCLNSN